MSERLYYNDSSLLSFSGRVTGIDEDNGRFRVRLDRTAFYPTSGGQLHDVGRLAGEPVIEVIDDGVEIFHILERKPSFSAGEDISGEIDPVRRRDNMQKHTGQHILSRAMIEVCNAETVSARLGEEDSTIDVNRENLGDRDLQEAEYLANVVIFENRPVTVAYVGHDKLKEIPLRKIPDREESEYRIVIIDCFDWSACGGTHCRATGSVGVIKITGREKMRGNMRLHFLTGLAALDDYRWRFDQIEKMSAMFTRHGRESLAAVEDMTAENAALRKRVVELKRELLPSRVKEWYDHAREVGGRKVIVLDFSGEDFKEAREAALGIINAHSAVAIIVADDKLLVAVAKDAGLSAADVLKRATELFGGRGGGSPQLAQGGGFSKDDIKVLLAVPEKILDI